MGSVEINNFTSASILFGYLLKKLVCAVFVFDRFCVRAVFCFAHAGKVQEIVCNAGIAQE